MNLEKSFIKNLQQNNLIVSNKKILLAVSGGLDSVVLTNLCYQCKINFEIAHCNFNLRGDESHQDEKFVTDLAKKMNVNIFKTHFDTNKEAQISKTSIEETARNLRYAWFEEIINENKFDCLFTAHHGDDNIETALMNFCRGTGIKGLRGILFKQNKIIRPLLFARREELENYAKQNNISYRTDATNKDINFTRNYFRNIIIPKIKESFSSVEENILQNIKRLQDVENIYNIQIKNFKKKLLLKSNEEYIISIGKLRSLPSINTVIYELFKDFNFTSKQVPDILNLLSSENGKYISNNQYRIIKHQNNLILTHTKQQLSNFYLIEKLTEKIIFENGNLDFSITDNKNISTDNTEAYLDANKITLPLLLRKIKIGDYFYPFGMRKKKKLSRFFIDNKFSTLQKENVWVLEMDKKIIWVVGHRIDDRFKIESNTKKILKIKFKVRN